MVTKQERDEAKRIVVGIIRDSGGVLYGTTRLYKIFYYAHLFHWEEQEGALTTYPIVHMPNGPGIDCGPSLIEELVVDGIVCSSTRQKGPYKEDVYTVDLARVADHLTAAEHASIGRAITHVGNADTKKLSDDAHDASRAWSEAQSGRELNIYLDTLSDLEYAQMRERQLRIRQLIDEVHA
jgi:hypothetical protein